MVVYDLPETGRGGLVRTDPFGLPPPYVEGNRAVLDCRAGYVPASVTVSVLRFSPSGRLEWTPARLHCQPLNELLDLPSTGPGGTVLPLHKAASPYHLHDQARLECNDGYLPPRDPEAQVVLQNGALVWMPSQLQCAAVQCLQPPVPLHGGVDHDQFEYPHAFGYVCDPGTRLVFARALPNRFACDASGWWSPDPVAADARCEPIVAAAGPTCPEIVPPDPDSFSVTLSDEQRQPGSVATLTCGPDRWLLLGDARRTCGTDGTWSGEAGVCDRIPCPEMDSSVKVTKRVGRMHFVQCGQGNGITVTCLPVGRWSLRHPYCNLEAETDVTSVNPTMLKQARKRAKKKRAEENGMWRGAWVGVIVVALVVMMLWMSLKRVSAGKTKQTK